MFASFTWLAAPVQSVELVMALPFSKFTAPRVAVPDEVEIELARKVPATCKSESGEVVPMPTLGTTKFSYKQKKFFKSLRFIEKQMTSTP